MGQAESGTFRFYRTQRVACAAHQPIRCWIQSGSAKEEASGDKHASRGVYCSFYCRRLLPAFYCRRCCRRYCRRYCRRLLRRSRALGIARSMEREGQRAASVRRQARRRRRHRTRRRRRRRLWHALGRLTWRPWRARRAGTCRSRRRRRQGSRTGTGAAGPGFPNA